MKPGNFSTLALLIGSFLVSAGLTAAPCPASDSVLCLASQRFSAEVRWRDFEGNTGAGRAVGLTADTGYFWFFSDSNVELVVKVLDARGFNGHFWVFFGALSNVEYTLTVTDTETGATKSYQNPSGQFASVGDTAAFTAAGGTATHVTVAAEGTPTPPESLEAIQQFIEAAAQSASEASAKKAAASTPCPGPSTSLYLSNCRFRLEAHWTDFEGRTGAGQAVQLTNDTGYFWFFSDNNVELIVKVLDARGFNERFWVFYGALSNVEYSLHVTDRVSGALRIYRNPSGNFASAGDTSAFRGGYSVAVTADTGRAASGEISAASGGTLSATAANGTVFTLEIPPHALTSDKTITMTPVTAVERLPFAGGLVAAVNLEPSGLYLLESARLTIRTSSPIPSSEETTFAWNGSGEELFLYPPAAASGDLKVHVMHLGGYGVARGTEGERQAQAPKEPAGEDDRLSHRIAPYLREGRAEARGATSMHPLSPTTWQSFTRAEYDAMYQVIRAQMAGSRGDPDEVVSLGTSVITWTAGVRNDLGLVDTIFPGRTAEIRSLVGAMIESALERIHERCSADVTAIRKLPQILRLIGSFRLTLDAAVRNALKCLNFKLTFESTTIGVTPAYRVTHTARAEVPLKIDPDPDLFEPERLFFHLIEGSGAISVTSIEMAAPRELSCSYAYDLAGSSTFEGSLNLDFDFERFDLSELALFYDPGNPPSNIRVTCEDIPPIDLRNLWRGKYLLLHEDELGESGRHIADGWTFPGGGRPFAVKRYVQGRAVTGSAFTEVHETTVMTIDHAPE